MSRLSPNFEGFADGLGVTDSMTVMAPLPQTWEMIDRTWHGTEAFFSGFTVFGPKSDPRPSCFAGFWKNSAQNFVGNIDTSGAAAATHAALSQLRPAAVPSTKALRGGLSGKQWLARNGTKQASESAAVGVLVNADLSMGQALGDEIGTAKAGNCK